MLSPGRRRRLRREPLIAAAVLIVAVAAVLAIVLSSGGSPSTSKPPPQGGNPASHHAAVDTFLWPDYGYTAARTRYFAAPPNLGPPLRKGWSYQDYALLEFPPVLYHDRLMFIDYDGSAKAVDKLTGRLIWQRKLGTLSAVSPAVDPVHGLVFIPLLSETPGARLPGNGRFFALSTQSGRVVWSRALRAGSESSPLVHGSNVYFGDAGGTVYSLRTSNGHLNWTFHASGAVKGGVAYARGKIFFGDYASRVYALNASNGHEVWATTTGGGGGTIYGSPAVAFGRVFVGNTNHHVYALSESSGRVLWDTPTSYYVYSSPAVANVRGLGPTVYAGSYDGHFYALNADSGAVRWTHASGAPISGSGTIIGHVIYYGVLQAKNSIGLNTRTGRQVFSYPDGEFAGAVADHHAIYLIGYSQIYQLLPKRK
jgi:outer membrane protein assembly factor BamB